jgi:REP element-mobilizing transposase RayT
MPRTARIDIPDLLQHVIFRGIERRDIFLDDDDRGLFVERFSKLLTQTGTECLAWAVLSNHCHLLLRPHATKLSVFMRRLLTGYAVVHNLRHQRSGHLFQNRYKSIVCEEDPYLLELVRYIHLNPLRAGMVKTIEELDIYPWTGHAVIMGKQELPGQQTDEVLSLFGKRKQPARNSYREFITDGIKFGSRDDLIGGGLRRSANQFQSGEHGAYDERVLGSGEFVEFLQQATESRLEATSCLPLEEIIRQAATAFGIEEAMLMTRSRQKALADARAAICYLAVRHFNFLGVDVAKSLNISRSGVSIAVRRGAEIVKDKQALLDDLFNNSTTSP